MNLQKVSDQKLDENLKSLVQSEREILSDILLHIAEVDRRKLYLSFGFRSLFDYLTQSVGYANGSAQRRIDAARLSYDVPEVIEKIESGAINLSQVSLVQKAIREKQSTSKVKVESKAKADLVEQLTEKSFVDSEIIVAQALDIEIKASPTIKHQKNESVRFEVTLSKSQWAKLEKMRELLSHSLPSGSWDQVLEYVSDKVIQKKDKTMAKKLKANNASTPVGKSLTKEPNVYSNSLLPDCSELNPPKENQRPKNITVSVESKTRHYIPVATQRTIFQRDQCCQYKDKHTGKQCNSHWQLSIDHIQPIWAGGTNEITNLRVLCANHNRHVYKQQANIRTH